MNFGFNEVYRRVPGMFYGRGGFCKLGHKFLSVLKVKVKLKHFSGLLPKITSSKIISFKYKKL